MSTGGLIVARVGMKPLATLNRPVLGTVDVVTKESTVSFKERTDVTAVPAMGVVAETMTALVLASEALRKFGGDSLAEVVRNRDGYLASLARHSVVGRRGRPWLSTAARGDDGRGEVDRGPAGRGAPRSAPASTPTRRWSGAPGSSVARDLLDRGARRPSGPRSRACLDAVLAGPDPAWSRWAAAPSSIPPTAAALRRSGTVVWLRARPETLARRVGTKRRPPPAGRRRRGTGPPRWPGSRPNAGRSTRRSPRWSSTSTTSAPRPWRTALSAAVRAQRGRGPCARSSRSMP